MSARLPAPRLHPWLLTCGLVPLGVVMGLILGEVLLRITGLAPIPGGMPGTSGWSHFPEHPNGAYWFSYGSLGYRTRDLAVEKRPGEWRLLFLGDSHLQGVGVDQSARASDILERTLAMTGHGGIAVLNFGKSGAGLPDYRAHLERGLPYRPDIVVLMLYTGNDLTDLAPGAASDLELMRALGLRQPASGAGLDDGVPGLRALARRTYLYHTLAHVESRIFRRQVEPDAETLGVYRQSLGQTSYFVQHMHGLAPALESFRAHLADIQARTDQARIPLVVALLPSRLQVDDDARDSLFLAAAQRYGVSPTEAFAMDARIHDSMMAIASGVAGHVLDLRPALRSSHAGARKYWPRDWHLNHLGHEIVGQTVSQYLQEVGLVHGAAMSAAPGRDLITSFGSPPGEALPGARDARHWLD